MAVNVYDPQQLVRIQVVFTNASGVVVDPGTLTLKVLTPDKTVTSYTYPANIVRDSTGNYHMDIIVTQTGDWWYKWFGSDPAQAAAESYFRVRVPKIQ